MTTQPSLFLATRPGVFAEAVSLAARNSHREPSTWVTKPRQSRPTLRRAATCVSVVIAVLGATLLIAA